MEAPSTCHYCGQPAALLCDGVLGYGFALEGTRRVRTMETPVYTCDRPLCARCAADSSPIFMDGTDASGKRWGETDSYDYCPGCEREGRAPGGMIHGLSGLPALWALPTEGAARQRARLDGAAPPAHLRLVQLPSR